MSLPIGTILDHKFKIVQILGEGGMGTVYKVEQIGTPPGSPPYYYAVKELLVSSATNEEERKSAIERFNKEIALLHGLRHQYIAGSMLPFQERGNYYFVMDFVPGRSLETILENAKGPLPEDQVIRWMIQVCEALTYIHTRVPPIILRDLKPGNIMITLEDEVRLIDFGIARRFDPHKRTNTENLGTISYASPEHLGSITAPGQRRSARNPGTLVQTDARSDVYSLGATMYHLLTNYEPDPIQTPAPGSILAKNPRLQTSPGGVCPIERVIIKAMQQDPAQRFQSAEAMRVALQQCLPAQAAPLTIQIPAISPNSTIIVQPMTTGMANGNAALICPKCGFQNRPGAKFCKRDGQPLVQGVAVSPPQARANAPIQARPVSRPQPIRARPALPFPNRTQNATTVTPAATVSQDPYQAAMQAGLEYLKSKEFLKAIEQFTKAKSLLQAKANARVSKKEGGTSVAGSVASGTGESLYDVLYNLGRAHRQYAQSLRESDKKLSNDNLKRAIEYFEEATRQKNDIPDAFFQLGLSYRDQQRPWQAISAFKKALAIDAKDPAIYYQLGQAALDQRATREAETYFQDGWKIKPDHPLLVVALGRLYTDSRRAADAIKILRPAVQQNPDQWEAWYELGRAHMKQKEWVFALSALERSRQLIGYRTDIYSAMATCYLKINQKAEAEKMVNEMQQRDPQHPETIRLKKQL